MEQGERAINFIEQLKPSKWAGRLRLSDWQKQYIRDLLEVDPNTGRRKRRKSLLFVARKNGKSTLISGLSLFFLLCEKEPGIEVVCCGGSAKQASIIFDEAAAMARANPSLKKRLVIRDSRKTIYHIDKATGRQLGRMMAIPSDADLQLGLNASHVIADEFQIYPDSSIWDALLTSQGTRKQPMAIAIGTAGVFSPESFGFRLYEYAKKVEANPEIDPTFLPCIFEAPKDADHTLESTWKAANPNYGVVLEPEYFKDWMRTLESTPSELDTFERWHLNRWTAADNAWFAPGAWKAANDSTFDIDSLRGMPCWCGLDLAAVSDLCAFVMVFPLDNGRFAVLCEFWCPRDNAATREKRDRAPYLTWSRQNFIHLTEGNIVDYSAIRARLNELKKVYQLRQIGVDMMFQGAGTDQDLQKDGFNTVAFGQGWRSMAAPTLELEKLVIAKRLIHFNNPVLAWNAANAVISRDAAGNMKIDKSKSREKVDGLVGLVMGLGCAMQGQNTGQILKGPMFV